MSRNSDITIDLYLRYARKLKGWRQVDLAKASGVDQSAISQMEQGRLRPTPKQLDRLSKALDGFPPDWLLRPIEVVMPSLFDYRP